VSEWDKVRCDFISGLRGGPSKGAGSALYMCLSITLFSEGDSLDMFVLYLRTVRERGAVIDCEYLRFVCCG
jgi:hypothetical protein